VRLIVGLDCLHAGDRFVKARERYETLAERIKGGQAGVLDECGLAGRETAGRAVPEPAAPQLDVDPLGDRELGVYQNVT
jgi:hypothetical protein